MFRVNYRTTLKTLLRSPATILAVIASLILIFTTTFEQHGPGFIADRATIVRQDIWNMVRCTVWNLLPAFLGIVIASNILSEKTNGFSDLLLSNRKSLLTFYISKILAIWTLALIMQLVFLGVWCISYWCFQQRSVTLEIGDIFRHYAVNEIIYMPLGILVYSSMAIFVGLATNISALGAIFNVGHYLIQYVFINFRSADNIISNYLYFIPAKLDGYTRLFNDIENLSANVNNPLSTTMEEALLAIGIHIFIAVSLLIGSYFILMHRYKD